MPKRQAIGRPTQFATTGQRLEIITREGRTISGIAHGVINGGRALAIEADNGATLIVPEARNNTPVPREREVFRSRQPSPLVRRPNVAWTFGVYRDQIVEIWIWISARAEAFQIAELPLELFLEGSPLGRGRVYPLVEVLTAVTATEVHASIRYEGIIYESASVAAGGAQFIVDAVSFTEKGQDTTVDPPTFTLESVTSQTNTAGLSSGEFDVSFGWWDNIVQHEYLVQEVTYSFNPLVRGPGIVLESAPTQNQRRYLPDRLFEYQQSIAWRLSTTQGETGSGTVPFDPDIWTTYYLQSNSADWAQPYAFNKDPRPIGRHPFYRSAAFNLYRRRSRVGAPLSLGGAGIIPTRPFDMPNATNFLPNRINLFDDFDWDRGSITILNNAGSGNLDDFFDGQIAYSINDALTFNTSSLSGRSVANDPSIRDRHFYNTLPQNYDLSLRVPNNVVGQQPNSYQDLIDFAPKDSNGFIYMYDQGIFGVGSYEDARSREPTASEASSGFLFGPSKVGGEGISGSVDGFVNLVEIPDLRDFVDIPNIDVFGNYQLTTWVDTANIDFS